MWLSVNSVVLSRCESTSTCLDVPEQYSSSNSSNCGGPKMLLFHLSPVHMREEKMLPIISNCSVQLSTSMLHHAFYGELCTKL